MRHQRIKRLLRSLEVAMAMMKMMVNDIRPFTKVQCQVYGSRCVMMAGKERGQETSTTVQLCSINMNKNETKQYLL